MAMENQTRDRKIGLREIRSLEPNTQIFDAGAGSVPGFGARRRKGDSVSYILMYRTEDGRQRLYTIGTHGAPWTPDDARTAAKRILGKVAAGDDPAADKQAKRKAETVDDLCDQYWADAEGGRLLTRRRIPKKASTLLSDKGRIDKHIRPLLGRMKVAAVTQSDVENFMHDVAEGKTAVRAPTGRKRGLSNVRGGMGVAGRTVGLLGAIFTYAMKHRMRADNPVHGVMRPADGKKERRLTDAEYAALAKALRTAAEVSVTAKGVEKTKVWPSAVAVTRFLALTGWRSSEALELRWQDIDLTRRTASMDTKTGRSIRPLSQAACQVLKEMKQEGKLVFPATRGAGAMSGYRSMFDRILKLGDLPNDITPHVLRHSFASLAADMEYAETTVAALIGHSRHTTTARYIHRADSVLLAAADVVANETLRRMGEKISDVTQLPEQVAG